LFEGAFHEEKDMAVLQCDDLSAIAGRIIKATRSKVSKSVKIPRSEYKTRWDAVQKMMAARGYDLLYCCGSELDRTDVAWLTGVFDPIIERYGVLVPAKGRPVVLAGSEGGHVLEESVKASGADVALLSSFQISDEDYRHAHFMTLEEVLKQIGVTPGGARLAIASSAQFVPYDHVTIFQAALGSDNVVFDTEPVQKIKYEKSVTELKVMREANVIADAAFRGMLAAIRPGVSELEVAGVADFIMKELGAGRTGFPTIVTAGERQYTVIGPATNNVIKDGDWVSLGVSPTFNGYHGILRRSVKCTARRLTKREAALQRAVEGLYKVVMDATIVAARAGKDTNYIDRRGKRYLEKLRLTTLEGKRTTPLEPYTFIHNTGCSECQEGYGAVTPYTRYPMAKNVALMIDVALLGFVERGKPLFDCLYAVVEDGFWKRGKTVGVYNRLPLNVQHLVGNEHPLGEVNPYWRPLR
jgi:Xaa-Pro aminopeptidase